MDSDGKEVRGPSVMRRRRYLVTSIATILGIPAFLFMDRHLYQWSGRVQQIRTRRSEGQEKGHW